jgi:hypothetical protein
MHVEGRAAVIETWQRMLGATVWLFRGSFTGVVAVDGDRATGRWPCVETGVFAATPAQPERHYDNRSLYEDLYVRSGGRWLIQRRRYLYLWLSFEKLPGRQVPLGEEITDG